MLYKDGFASHSNILWINEFRDEIKKSYNCLCIRIPMNYDEAYVICIVVFHISISPNKSLFENIKPFCSLSQWINSSHSSAEVQFVSAFDSFIINRLYHQNVARLMPICNGSIVLHRKSELKIMPLYLFFMLESRMMSHRNVKCKTLDVRRFSCVNTNVSHMQKVSRHHQRFPNLYYRDICMYA